MDFSNSLTQSETITLAFKWNYCCKESNPKIKLTDKQQSCSPHKQPFKKIQDNKDQQEQEICQKRKDQNKIETWNVSDNPSQKNRYKIANPKR